MPNGDLLDRVIARRGTAGRVFGLLSGLLVYLCLDAPFIWRVTLAIVTMRIAGPWLFELALRPLAAERERRRALERLGG